MVSRFKFGCHSCQTTVTTVRQLSQRSYNCHSCHNCQTTVNCHNCQITVTIVTTVRQLSQLSQLSDNCHNYQPTVSTVRQLSQLSDNCHNCQATVTTVTIQLSVQLAPVVVSSAELSVQLAPVVVSCAELSDQLAPPVSNNPRPYKSLDSPTLPSDCHRLGSIRLGIDRSTWNGINFHALRLPAVCRQADLTVKTETEQTSGADVRSGRTRPTNLSVEHVAERATARCSFVLQRSTSFGDRV